MDKHDLENLKFILTRKPSELVEWWDTLSDDDRNYAIELVQSYRKQLEKLVSYDDVDGDTTLVKNYLKKFQLPK